MPGPTVNWEFVSGGAALPSIAPSGRYRLDSPATVTGAPSFAMQSASQSAIIRVYLPTNRRVESPLTVSGTTLVALVGTGGKPLSVEDLAALEIEVELQPGEVLLTTDEPNGTLSSPFATVAERDAAMPPGIPHRRCYMLNEFAPLAPGVPGTVEFIDTGAAWILAPEQVLANYSNADGSALLDTTASALGLTVGASADIWTSAILPSWMVTGYMSLFFAASFSDPTSTAAVTMRGSIGAGVIPGTDPNDALVGAGGAAATFRKGLVLAPINFYRVGNSGFCTQGLTPFQATQNTPRTMPNSLVDSRIRVNFVPGALTNSLRVQAVILKTGPC